MVIFRPDLFLRVERLANSEVPFDCERCGDPCEVARDGAKKKPGRDASRASAGFMMMAVLRSVSRAGVRGTVLVAVFLTGLVAPLLLPPSVSAMTTDGTLITNVACSTYGSVGGCAFEVSYCATQTVLWRARTSSW